MLTSQYITERTGGSLTLVDDSPSSTTVLGTNEYFALVFCTQYRSYLRNYVQYKGFSNYNEDLDLYDIDLNKNGFDTGYYVSKDYYNLKKVFKQVREDRGRIIVVSLNDSSTVIFIDEDRTPISAPVATAATLVTTTSFSANWNIVSGALGYYLDVSTSSDFSSYVTGYENKDVNNVLSLIVTGLNNDETYYYRIRAYNNNQTSNNSNIITTIILVDIDGNSYTYVTIGTQQWLAENLKTTTYRDGTPIPNLTIDANWIGDNIGSYCYYDNDVANKAIYGALYNWYAVNNVHGLAPTGWRIPSIADWETLKSFLGGELIAGGKLKTITFGGTNDYGFNSGGGGMRFGPTGQFTGKDNQEYWYTSNIAPALRGYYTQDTQDELTGPINNPQTCGYSIRCMRDL